MRISKTTQNALQILIAAAQAPEQLLKGATLARHVGLTEHNTSKIVYLLARGGFIRSVRGPQGGMQLARRAEEIMIGDVVMAIEELSLAERMSRSGSSRHAFAAVVDEAMGAFVAVLNQHTLADFARANRNPGVKGLAAPAKTKRKSRKVVAPARARRPSANARSD